MKLKSFIGAAGACALAAGVMVGVAGPAAADPAGPSTSINVDGGGSDTTQDVMNAIANDAGYSSWNALNPTTGAAHDLIDTKTTAACTDISRPNGSSEGVAALRRSLSATSTATYPGATWAAGSGCFDFARSSSGPGGNASPQGLLQYIPFALDGVTVAVGPASGADATVIGGTFDLAELQAMYSAGTPAVASNGVTYDPRTDDGLTGTEIHLLIPQPGSGTRNFFAGAMGINATTPPAWVRDTFTPTAGGAAQSVQEHDGTAVRLDHNALMPYSIAQWLSQQSHPAIDRRDGARLQNIGTLSPFDSTGLRLNTQFHPSLVREVYNVISRAAVDAGTSNTLNTIFVGSNPLVGVCSFTGRITEYGFGTIGSRCGVVDPNLRAFATL
ncbi:hypothetical protein RB614_42270 [Phytohabitans sp. ZYX-F-186]|uniref:PBP domain-containing protein n=1 Tax=Phytohabitans maris TaxID=3071409 RepID=A0ABU0ZWF9_9ACTN|nr:hypothetical protein [Phytohabitans sp. ZYX-F-186]MDQ7911136.1 hypothetical protein [Phytohabitans sp. ZYX-F-186]